MLPVLAISLLAIGVVLIWAELGLPAHGMLALLGGAAMIGAVAATFAINSRLGFAAMLALAVTAPVVAIVLLQLWPRTPLARRMMLKPVEQTARIESLAIGATGAAVSEMRPGGVCEFDGQRVQAFSSRGIIPTGSPVRIVSIEGDRTVVKMID